MPTVVVLIQQNRNNWKTRFRAAEMVAPTYVLAAVLRSSELAHGPTP